MVYSLLITEYTIVVFQTRQCSCNCFEILRVIIIVYSFIRTYFQLFGSQFVGSYNISCESIWRRVPLYNLEQNGPAWAVAELETRNTDENVNFWNSQPVNCEWNEETGKAEWDFSDLVPCEERGCPITEDMRSASKMNMSWGEKMIWKSGSNTPLPLKVNYGTLVNFTCPNGKQLSTFCATFFFTTKWTHACDSISALLYC